MKKDKTIKTTAKKIKELTKNAGEKAKPVSADEAAEDEAPAE